MACGNVKQIYGLTFEEKTLSERQMLLLLHGMVQKGMLCVVENRLRPCGNYKYILDLVRSSEYFLSLEYVRDDSIKRGSLYLGEQLLWVENSNCRKETYEITLVSKNDWEEWLLEQHFFTCYRSQETEKDWRKSREVKEGKKKFRMQLCRVETGESSREISMYETMGKEYLIRKDRKSCFVIIYHQNHLLKELKSWIQPSRVPDDL